MFGTIVLQYYCLRDVLFLMCFCYVGGTFIVQESFFKTEIETGGLKLSVTGVLPVSIKSVDLPLELCCISVK